MNKSIKYLLGTSLLIVGIYFLWNKISDTHFIERENDTTIDSTGMQIDYLKEIGEWEFLTLRTEEIEDTTVETGLFSESTLSNIYKGTLRLGIDMSELDERSLQIKGDTFILRMPPIKLLDENFINEAETRVFYAKGEISPQIKDELYEKAKRKMKKRALSVQNIAMAKETAESQITKIISSFGYKTIQLK